MKKSFSIHYDDEDDKDLLEYINNARGKASRSAFVMNVLYDLKNGKLNCNSPVTNEIIKNEPEENQSKKQEIDKKTVENFKNKFGK